MDSLHDIIQQTLKIADCKPVQFEKPLKNVHALVKLTKTIVPKNLSERSQAVGWCLSSLLDYFGKGLFHIESLIVKNEKNEVTAEAIVHIRGQTFEIDHTTWLDGIISTMTNYSIPAQGYCWTRLYWSWDTAERMGEVTRSIQSDGSGNLHEV